MKLIQITAPHFTAGIVLKNDVVVKTAPIVKYMKGWNIDKVMLYVGKKNWDWEICSANKDKNGLESGAEK